VIAISPCPNDTFLFAHYQGLPLTFGDIQHLNEWALEGRYPICKVSFALLPRIPEYEVLPVGAALGWHCGPILVAKEPFEPGELSSKRVAVPGRDTTAHLLLQRLLPEPLEKRFYLFHETLDAMHRGEVDCAVLIHEQRFTHKSHLICDLGQMWHETSGLPVPLGGLVARRSLPANEKKEIVSDLRLSLEKAWADPQSTYPFVLRYAQEMAPEVVQAHIDTYVTDETHTLSDEGWKSIARLCETTPSFCPSA